MNASVAFTSQNYYNDITLQSTTVSRNIQITEY